MSKPSPTPGGIPNGGSPQPKGTFIKAKSKQNTVLFGKKKQMVFKPTSGQPQTVPNGTPRGTIRPPRARSPAALNTPSPGRGTTATTESRSAVSGFSDPSLVANGVQYRDFKLVTTKRELLQGLRFHILNFNGDKPIDIRNDSDFPRPVRLHRRDARIFSSDQTPVENGPDSKNSKDDDEKAEIDKRKEARRLEREENLAQVAPSAETGKKPMQIKKKTAQVFNRDYTAEERKAMQDNYEERLPWHIEDFDNKRCFVGSHQAGSSHLHAAFLFENTAAAPNGRFRLLPIEKMYQFKQRKSFRALTIEEAEKAMKKRGQDPKWFQEKKEESFREAQLEQASKQGKAFFGTRDDNAAGRVDDAVDLDFNMEEDFADDEEGDAFFGKDEDEQLADKRIHEDLLTANVFDAKLEKEYDRAEQKEQQEKEQKKSGRKKIRKALEKREKNYDHGSESEDDPYGSSTDSENTEAERQRVEAEKKAKADLEAKQRSGLSTGSNTPSGRKEKRPSLASDREGGMKKSTSSKSLKRPGSPNISDASGTDASIARKRKKNHHLSSTQPTPFPSRPLSPVNAPPSSAPVANLTANLVRRDSSTPQTDKITSNPNKKRKSIAPGTGAGSDTDAAMYTDGGAMSEASRKQKRLKLNVGPKTSGARSPSSAVTPQGGSRASSPKPSGPAPSSQPSRLEPDPANYPSAAEVFAAIPSSGITTTDLSNKFRARYRKEDRMVMATLIRRVARLDKTTKLLFPNEGFRP